MDAFTLRGSMCFDQVSRYFRSQSIELERERKKKERVREEKRVKEGEREESQSCTGQLERRVHSVVSD